MQNALYYQIVCLGICCLILSCQSSSDKQETLSTAEVELEDQNGWLLTVAEDGSGSLSCASLRHQVVRWPAGTFPFEKLRLLPPFEPRIQDDYPFRWTYHQTLQAELRQYSLPDTSWAARWFVLAHDALMHQQGHSFARQQLKRQWRVDPPVGVEEEIRSKRLEIGN
ncbi:MAG: hypothetical protein AAFO02_09500 [Bacteroidota bacterium]